jgi:hypothetical protein
LEARVHSDLEKNDTQAPKRQSSDLSMAQGWGGQVLQDDSDGDLISRIVPTLREVCWLAAGLQSVSLSIVSIVFHLIAGLRLC